MFQRDAEAPQGLACAGKGAQVSANNLVGEAGGTGSAETDGLGGIWSAASELEGPIGMSRLPTVQSIISLLAES